MLWLSVQLVPLAELAHPRVDCCISRNWPPPYALPRQEVVVFKETLAQFRPSLETPIWPRSPAATYTPLPKTIVRKLLVVAASAAVQFSPSGEVRMVESFEALLV